MLQYIEGSKGVRVEVVYIVYLCVYKCIYMYFYIDELFISCVIVLQ